MPFNREGPPIEALHHHLCEIPPEFFDSSRADPAALAHDVSLSLDAFPDTGLLRAVRDAADAGKAALVPLCCWLLTEPGLRRVGVSTGGIRQLLAVTAIELARYAKPKQAIDDVDRREELIRLALSDLDMRPAGETAVQAQDRLSAISSVERERIVRAAQAAEARAKEIREALARQAAQEAADKWTRE